MANISLSMRKFTEVLRLYFEHSCSKHEIARIIGASPRTVTGYLTRAKLAGRSYPLPPDLDEAALERRLFSRSGPSTVERPHLTGPRSTPASGARASPSTSCDRVKGRTDLRLPVQRLLRTLPALAPPSVAVDAPDLHAGRAAVHRQCRPTGAYRRDP